MQDMRKNTTVIISRVRARKKSVVELALEINMGVSDARHVSATDASASTKESSELVEPTPVASGSPNRAKSIAPAGTILKGIQFHQGKPDPVALPDSEYPKWLWKLLEEPSASSSSLASPSRKPRIGEKVEVTIKGQKVTLDKKDLRKKNRDNIRVGCLMLRLPARKTDNLLLYGRAQTSCERNREDSW